LGGVAGPRASYAPAASDVVRYEHEVVVQSLRQGCRWQPFDDPAIQVADCGDERDPVRLVFQGGKVTEYRIVVRLDPQRPSPTPAAPFATRTALSAAGVANTASAAARSTTPGAAPPNPTTTPQA
jgi:hypothetical protein